MLETYLKPGMEQVWKQACYDLQDDFSDAQAHQILSRVLSAREVIVPLSPPPSRYLGDPRANEVMAFHQKQCREAASYIKRIKRWAHQNKLLDAWIRSGGSHTMDSVISGGTRRRGPRANPFLQHLLLGVMKIRPTKLVILDSVLAKLCISFDPAAGKAMDYRVIEAARKRLRAKIGPPVRVQLLIKSEGAASAAARAFFRSRNIRMAELNMSRFSDAPRFALLVEGVRLVGFNRKKVEALLKASSERSS
jgi:hypothetical protein